MLQNIVSYQPSWAFYIIILVILQNYFSGLYVTKFLNISV